jgi:hypothetical protein
MTGRKRAIGACQLLFATALATAAGGASCGAHDAATSSRTSGLSSNVVYHASRKRAGGAQSQVSLLAGAFLPASSEALPGFAYYAYLLFTDGSPSSAPARRAASAAYLGMLSRVATANERAGVRRADMAVLYVPLADTTVAGSLIKEREPQALLAAYSYVRARAIASLLKRAGKTVPDVAIIGSTRPLAAKAAINPETIDVVDLSDPGTVEERMERFRNSLQAGEGQLIEGGRPIVLKRLREYFAWAEAPPEASRVLTF